jgi:hypothetical protein
VVIGFTAGTGLNLGRVGALVCIDGGKRPFNIGTGLIDAQRDAPPPVGSCITYRYRHRSRYQNMRTTGRVSWVGTVRGRVCVVSV